MGIEGSHVRELTWGWFGETKTGKKWSGAHMGAVISRTRKIGHSQCGAGEHG